MSEPIQTASDAIDRAQEYAHDECVGTPGEDWDAEQTNGDWVVVYTTHTYTEEFQHRLRMTSLGNVYDHERGHRLE
jgi:hypothetical protein